MNSTEPVTIRERDKMNCTSSKSKFFSYRIKITQNPTLLSPVCAPTLRACPQNSYLHLAVRGIAVVLGHRDTVVGKQPGKLCTQEALDTVYWLIRSPKIPEFDFPVTPRRNQEMTEKTGDQIRASREESACCSLPHSPSSSTC